MTPSYTVKRPGLFWLPQLQLERISRKVCALLLGVSMLISMGTFGDKQGDTLVTNKETLW